MSFAKGDRVSFTTPGRHTVKCEDGKVLKTRPGATSKA